VRRGHRVHLASDGRKALEELQIADCKLQIENQGNNAPFQSAI